MPRSDVRVPPADSAGFVPIGSLHLVALAAAVALGASGALTAANQRLALTNGIELLELAHAEARTTALRTGRSVRLELEPDGSRIRVTYATLDPPGSDPLIREVVAPSVTFHATAGSLCFDGFGRPTPGRRCDPHRGDIEVRTLTEAARLTLEPDGRLTR